MEFVIVFVAAMCAAALTMYSGFGLGTLLLPAFALFFPVETAVAATAVVHLANNILKISLLGRYADANIVLRFGLPAVIAAFFGAATLGFVSDLGIVVTYSLAGVDATITPVKLVMGVLMAGFAMVELAPSMRSLSFDRKYLVHGGVLSGFFGGLSGHQGALRSAFLVKVPMSTQAYVGTNAVIGMMVDTIRIITYLSLMLSADLMNFASEGLMLVVTGICAAMLGVLVARRFLHKVTMGVVQTITGTLLMLIAVLLAAGII